jgi:magnesium transporter
MGQSLTSRRREKIGLPPGSLVFTGKRVVDHIQYQTFIYDSLGFKEEKPKSLKDLHPENSPAVHWVNITGIHDIAAIESIGKQFGIHPLVLEDILHTEQRPKMEDLGDSLFLVLRMATVIHEMESIEWEQVSMVVRGNLVITFQEYPPGDVFDSIRDRIRFDRGRIRKCGPDYLVYSLIDAIIDQYFGLLESFGERLEQLEERVVDNPDPSLSHEIYQFKREMIFLRKAVWPLRDLISCLQRLESKLFNSETMPFIKDLYDHTIRVMETVDMYRDIQASILDIYLSSVSNRMNAIMKVLTIIATIFMPLTFMAGVYGMNFRYMPELDKPWAYPALWILMLCVAIGMLFYFKRKGWI